MIETVTRQDATWAVLPHKFEAGTVNAADACGLKAAIEYYGQIGFAEIVRREEELTELLRKEPLSVPHLRVIDSLNPGRIRESIRLRSTESIRTTSRRS